MASPIIHVAYTQKIYKKLFSDKNEREFYIGTLYPDIRYLATKNPVLSRHYTHLNFGINSKNLFLPGTKIDLRKIQKANSFKAGKSFHSFIDLVLSDEVISGIMAKRNIKVNIFAFKLLQDEILYDKVPDWNKYRDFLKETLRQESNFLFSKSQVKDWHNILSKYFAQKPDDNSRIEFGKKIGYSRRAAESINAEIKALKTDREILSLIEELYVGLEEFIGIEA